ncbi:vWA domain-containing protein [Roseivivax isoporae]|uniref:VWFA domain-containing protein n=1 Tax=Roseivivax isoporae LMG 25204 TaxID=1449351 RepID=X7F6D3_9RHOB|nr:VWA domain-containing protein [Roseivivax isoporae]ETX27609.1 hypothetical protein RISW2_13290 [Roseivivax isoporae LMG 25204]
MRERPGRTGGGLAAGLRGLRAALLAGCLMAPAGRASELCTDDAMIVFDGSGSMSEIGFDPSGAPRIIEARRAVREAIPGIAGTRRLGLIVYGPGGNPVCDNVHLRFGPVWGAADPIIGAVEALWPAGATPLTDAVLRAAEVLDYRNRPGAILLITDGKETCGGAPCRLASHLAAAGRDLTVHVVGFRLRPGPVRWGSRGAPDDTVASVARCLADATGGQYVTADSADDLVAAMRVTLGCNLMGAAPARDENRPG